MLRYLFIIYSKVRLFFEEMSNHNAIIKKRATTHKLQYALTLTVLMFIFSNKSNAQVVTTWGGLSGTVPENSFQTSSLSAVGDGVTFVTVNITRGPSATTGGAENAVPPSSILTTSMEWSRL
ncbi:MAG: hypothetical protein AB8B65_15915 [Kordia sp.]|uniref:hypothetical protein n=1 Tax=Kordia sp. TaxID=1965332 RepID=UPI0038592F6D